MIASFLAQAYADRDSGEIQPLAAYQALFPGYEAVVEREYRALLKEEDPATPAAKPEFPAEVLPRNLRQFGHFTILTELGRGGHGVVYLALDNRLHRRVALKVLSAAAALSVSLRTRLFREAEAASRLDHPGICPVHDVGEEGGLPYIAMRYIEGETLASKLTAARKARDSEGETFGLDLRNDGEQTPSSTSGRRLIFQVVDLVERVARALHVAHEAGIIHRDVKPGNIMVTRNGDPILLDFGLARDESTNVPSMTQTGQLMGTPAYMAPEQIATERVVVDRRADLYALGVTLYECLTLERPFRALTREQLYKMILETNPRDPSRLNPRIPSDLKAVLEVVLDKDRDRRYQTAADFADDLRRVRQFRPILARPPGRLARLHRWGKRRPTLALLLLVLAVGVPLLAAVAGYLFANLGRIQEATFQERRRDLEGFLEAGFLELGEGRFRDAIEKFEAALALEPESPEAVAGLVRAHIGLDKKAECLAVLDRYATAEKRHPELRRMRAFALRVVRRPAEARRIEEGLGRPKTALGFFLAGQRIASFVPWPPDPDRLRAALEHYRNATLHAPHARLLYVLARIDVAVELGDKAELERLASAVVALWPESFMAWFHRGRALTRLGSEGDSADAYREALRLNPSHVWSHNRLGKLYCDKGDFDRAGLHFREAMRLAPDDVVSQYNLGACLIEQGELDAAIAQLRKTMRMDPAFAHTYSALARALEDKGERKEAVAVCREAVRLRLDFPRILNQLSRMLKEAGDPTGAVEPFRQWVEYEPKNAKAHVHLGRALSANRQYEEALQAHRKAIELDPDDAEAHCSMGHALARLGRYERARAAFEKAVEIEPGRRCALASIGSVLVRLGQFDRAIEHLEGVIKADPKSARGIMALANALKGKGRLHQALVHARKAVELAPKSAPAQFTLGTILRVLKDTDGALRAYREAIRLDPKHADAHCNLGDLLRALGKLDPAIKALREALKTDPKHRSALLNLGAAYQQKGEFEEAIQVTRELVKLYPKDVDGLSNLGCFLDDVGRYDEAEKVLRRAIRTDPKVARSYVNLAEVLRRTRRREEAMDSLHKAIELDPRLALAHFALGNLLQAQKEFDKAVKAYQGALEINPHDPDAHYRLARSLKGLGELDKAVEHFRKAIEIKPDFAEAHCDLGWTLDQQGKCREALRYFRRGHALGSARENWPNPSRNWVRFSLQRTLQWSINKALVGLGISKREDASDAGSRARFRREAARGFEDLFQCWGDIFPAGANARIRGRLRLIKNDKRYRLLKDRKTIEELPSREREQWRAIFKKVDALLEEVIGRDKSGR